MEILDQMMQKSRIAQQELEKYSQSQVDALVKAMAKAVYDNAELLAKEAVEETGMGVYEDKIAKNRNTAMNLWKNMEHKKTVGIINRDVKKGLVYIAKPKGVVGAVSPTTNPSITPLGNAMFAIKGRNSIIVAPHPRSVKVSVHTVELMNEAIQKLGAPENLIQIMDQPAIELTQGLMKACDVIVATGGEGLVKAAYSSGKPAFGVGAGNVQAIIDRECDVEQAAKDIIMGRKFDNGIICAGQQSVIAPVEQHAKIMETFAKHGAYYIENEADVEKFRNVLFHDGAINGKIVGLTANCIAKEAGVDIPEGTLVVILKGKGKGEADILCKEKMCPVLVTLTYDTFDEAIDIAKANLLFQGAGHSVAIYSTNDKHVDKVGESLPVGRIAVNFPSIFVNGSPNNGFNPTTTLGCGSWGNNSISENLTCDHLLNISVIGYWNKDAKVYNGEEIF
jgi:succinate-semialdehyde dehydrogenase